MAIHRAYGHVERADGDGPLRVVMATEGRKADGIDLRMSGADLSRFRRNPILGFGHAYWGRQNLPIGRVEDPAVEGTQLVGRLAFDQADPFAVEVERKMRAGYLNAVSIGFEVTAWESEADNYWRGGVATGWELSELSVVPVPMDANAVVAGRGLAPADAEFIGDLTAALGEQIAEAFTRRHNQPPAQPAPTDPDGIDVQAARGLLAAFDTEGSR